MAKLLRSSSAIVILTATAGSFALPQRALAQSRPFATTGDYQDVAQGNVTPGALMDNGDHAADTDVAPHLGNWTTGISPDDAHGDEAPTDLTSAEQARQDNGRDQSRMQQEKTRRRRPSIFDQASPRDDHAVIVPYIEAGQVVDAELSPRNTALTYSTFAAGIDAAVNGRNNQGTLALRVERQQGWGKAGSDTAVSGIGRLSSAIVKDTLRMEVAGYANNTRIDGNGSANAAGFGASDTVSQIYSVYGGPTLTTNAGEARIDAHYRIGYSHIGTPGNLAVTPGQTVADIFDYSVVQDAQMRVSTRPGDAGLPVGLAVEGGLYKENISNLDQRARDAHIRGEVTVPITPTAALIGGIGYEKVVVDNRDALLDAGGNPIYSAKGRLQTDYNSPRRIALDTEGLIWDAGVTWRPGPRTELEAHVGRRYGEIGGYGHFSYRPTSRSSISLLVYNNLAGFGGQLTNSLFNMPTQFRAVRDGLTGNVTTCVNSLQGACLSGVLGAVRSNVYRSRGATLAYNLDLGRLQGGFGAGYDRRSYLAAPGTILAPINGTVDEYYWVAGYVSGQITQQSLFTVTLDSYWFRTGGALNSDSNSVRASGLYEYAVTRHVSASAALSIDEISRQSLGDFWDTSAKVGVRYSF